MFRKPGGCKPLDVDDPPAESEDSQFYVRMFKHDFGDPPWRRPLGRSHSGFVLASESWGSDDEELGRTLLRDLLQTMGERKDLPEWILLINAGVRLGLKGAECLGFLQALESMGVKVLVSKTSLYHFGVETELRVGEAVTMFEIIETLYRAEKVISL